MVPPLRPARAELRALLVLAFPMIVARLSHVVMGLVDTIMAGTVSAEAVGALGLGSTLYFFALIFAIGTLLGLEPWISQAWGAGDPLRARRGLTAGLWIALAFAPFVMLWCLHIPDALQALGQPAEVVPLVRVYLGTVLWAVVPALLFQALCAALAATGWSAPLLWVSLVGNVVNVVANLVLVRGVSAEAGLPFVIEPMGIAGIAWATVSAQALMFLLMLFVWGRHRHAAGLRPIRLLPDADAMRGLLRLGLPVGVQYALELAAFGVVTLLIGRFGAAALAANQVALSIVGVGFTIALGLGAAAGVRTGQAVGRGDRGAVARAGHTGFAAGAVIAALCALLLILFREPLAALYLPAGEARDLAATLLLVAAIFQLADATQAIGFGVLRGLGDTRVPLLFNLLGYYALGIPAGALLAWGFGLQSMGLWLGLSLALFLVSAALLHRFRGHLKGAKGARSNLT